jgi:hypothetical protein
MRLISGFYVASIQLSSIISNSELLHPLCNFIKCSLLIITLALAELSGVQTLRDQFQFTISKTEDSISGVMENIVNPGVLSISTHLEESRSVATKSTDFDVDEREGHNQ